MAASVYTDPQTQPVSLRLNQKIRSLIDIFRQGISERTGKTLTTSDILKHMLETAREERLETVELLANPTESLLAIRRKKESGYPLTRAEWTTVAYYAQRGAEAAAKNGVSRESLTGIIQAFAAAYELRIGTSHEDEYYLTHLPSECRSDGHSPASPDLVRETVAETLRRLRESPSKPGGPVFAARNLYVLLDGDKLPGPAVLDEALSPFWSVLWRVAARGHYVVNRCPIRDSSGARTPVYHAAIPTVSEQGYTVSVTRGEGHDFALYLNWPGPRGTSYPLTGHAVIAEFRAMLTAVDPDLNGPQQWDGEHFFGYAVKQGDELDFGFRAHANGIAFTFSREDWYALRELFRQAWELPDIRASWDALTLEYGEW